MDDRKVAPRGGLSKASFASTLRSPSRLTILIFGGLAALLGLIGLVHPEATLNLLGFNSVGRDVRQAGDYTLVFLIASSMAAVNMGAYYVLAALLDVRPFFIWTVPFRTLTFCVFTLAVLRGLAPLGFVGVGVWELVGAAATGLALRYERRRQSPPASVGR
jgi:Na+-driven multidrug efflux pump